VNKGTLLHGTSKTQKQTRLMIWKIKSTRVIHIMMMKGPRRGTEMEVYMWTTTVTMMMMMMMMMRMTM
jgi:hypothetical protein